MTELAGQVGICLDCGDTHEHDSQCEWELATPLAIGYCCDICRSKERE